MTSNGVLRINCERQGNDNTWHRFGKEFTIPQYCDTNEVSAKFERGVLSIKFPKLITPIKPQEQETITNPPQEASIPKQHSDEPKTQAQVIDDQQESPKENISDEKENKKIEKKDENKVKPNDELLETKEVNKSTINDQGTQKGKMIQRLKTRALDFSISLKSGNDKDVNQLLGFGCGDTRPKMGMVLVNLIVAILLVLVIGVYAKNALWSSSKSFHGESKEF